LRGGLTLLAKYGNSPLKLVQSVYSNNQADNNVT